jgi:hypothetical protein
MTHGTYSAGPTATGDAGVGYGGIPTAARRTANLTRLAEPFPLASLLVSAIDATRAIPATVEVRATITRRTVRESVSTAGRQSRCSECGGCNPDLSIGSPNGAVRLTHSECDAMRAARGNGKRARAARQSRVTQSRDDSIILPEETTEERATRVRDAINHGVY